MNCQIDGEKIIVTIALSVAYDSATGGYVVIEKDGPSDLNHEVRWGPMPHYLVDEFLRQRGKELAYHVDKLTERMFEKKIWGGA